MKIDKSKTPISYYGGKQMMLRHILPLIPDHKCYVESYFGGGALFFAKAPSQMEVINDLNREAINFYKTLQTHYDSLNQLVQTTLHSRATYEDAMVIYKSPHLFDEVRRAWAFWVATQMGFSSKIGSWAVERQKNAIALKNQNKKLAFGEHLKMRLEKAQIECKSAIKVIRHYDSNETFHFIDPPYFNSDCAHYSGYTIKDLEEQLKVCSEVKGKFILTNYPSDILYDYCETYGWKKQEFIKKLAVTKNTKRNKIEVIVANFDI